MKKLTLAAILSIASVGFAWSTCQVMSLSDPTKVSKTGDTMNGDLILEGANTDIVVGGKIHSDGTLTVVSSATFEGNVGIPQINVPLTVTSSVTLKGGNVGISQINIPITFTSSATFLTDVLGNSSITASAFFGDGSHLTGVNTSGNNTIGFVSDNFLSNVDGSQTVFTLSNTPSSPAAIRVVLDGLLQSSTSDYTYTSPTTITMTNAPAQNSSSFFVQYSSGITATLTDGTNCSAGSFPLGVDAGGNVQSCTVAIAGASNNAFSGNNTFTGTNSFQNSIYISATSTIGPQGYATAITKSSGTLNNIWQVVASNAPSAVSSLSFTGLTANRFYRIHYNLKQNTATGIFQAKFNNDGGTLYAVSDQCNASNASSDNYNSAGATFWRIEGVGVPSGGRRQGYIEFSNLSDNTSFVNTDGLSTYWANTASPPIMEGCRSHAVYTGGSAVTSIQLGVDAGTFTGYVYVEELIVPNP